MKVRIVFTGRGYDVSEKLPGELTLEEGASVEDALTLLSQQTPEDVSLPATCLVAVSGKHLGTLANFESRVLHEGEEILLIAPVAGG